MSLLLSGISALVTAQIAPTTAATTAPAAPATIYPIAVAPSAHSALSGAASVGSPTSSVTPGGTAASQAPTDIRFNDFFKHPIGPRGLMLNPALVQLSGQRVRIVGYQVTQEEPTSGRFFLSPRPISMSEQADGAADDLAPSTLAVFLPALQQGDTVAPRHTVVQITGVLNVGRTELPDGRVSWFQLQLEPTAR